MKKLLKIFGVIIVICLIAILTIKLCFTFNKGAVSPVAIEDIKSVQIINLDRSTNRREGYEKKLKNAYGDEFLGQKIGDAIRLSGTDGVKDLVIIELDDQGNEVKNVDIAKLKAKEIALKNGVNYKVFDKNYPDFVYKYRFDPENIIVDKKVRHRRHLTVGEFGCMLSHLRAIRNVADNNNGDIGMILEDDFYIPDDFYDNLKKVLQQAPSNFGIIKLDSAKGGGKDHFSKNSHKDSFLFSDLTYGYNKYFYNNKSEIFRGVAGTSGYIITKEFAKKIVKLFETETINGFEGCSDILLFMVLPKKYNIENIWIVKKPVLWQNGEISEIARINYDNRL